MRVETNVNLVRRNRKIAQYLFFGSFGVPLIGLLLINQQAANPSTGSLIVGFIIPLLVLPLAYAITLISVRMANQWVRAPRPEDAIPQGLKGIGNKAVLYNYFHLPARHVLIAPQGVFAIVTRFQDARFTVDGEHWTTHRSGIGRAFSLFRMDNIGNPTQDARRAAEHVKKLLEPIAPDVPVQPVIVFTDPRANVEIISTDVPVVYAAPKRDPGFKDYVRGVGAERRPMLTPEQIAAFEEATLRQ
jgi:hypothetical protein